MGFTRDDFTQPVCLTLVYNIFTGLLISSTVESNVCELSTEFDIESKNLTIRVPFVVEGTLNINDQFQANFRNNKVVLKPHQPPVEQILIENTAKEDLTIGEDTDKNNTKIKDQKKSKTKKTDSPKK